MVDGDRNTKLFHRVASSRLKSFIMRIFHQGHSEKDSYNTISLEDAMELRKDFFEEEV